MVAPFSTFPGKVTLCSEKLLLGATLNVRSTMLDLQVRLLKASPLTRLDAPC